MVSDYLQRDDYFPLQPFHAPQQRSLAAHPFSIAAVRQVQRLDAHVVAVHSEPLRIAFGQQSSHSVSFVSPASDLSRMLFPSYLSCPQLLHSISAALEHPRRPSQDSTQPLRLISAHCRTIAFVPSFQVQLHTCFAHSWLFLHISYNPECARKPFVDSIIGYITHLAPHVVHLAARTTLHHLCPTALSKFGSYLDRLHTVLCKSDVTMKPSLNRFV